MDAPARARHLVPDPMPDIEQRLGEAPTVRRIIDVLVRHGLRSLGCTGGVLVVEHEQRLVPITSIGSATGVLAAVGPIAVDAPLPLAEAHTRRRAMWHRSHPGEGPGCPSLDAVARRDAVWAGLPVDIDGRHLGTLGFSFSRRALTPADQQRVGELCALAAPLLLQRLRESVSIPTTAFPPSTFTADLQQAVDMVMQTMALDAQRAVSALINAARSIGVPLAALCAHTARSENAAAVLDLDL